MDIAIQFEANDAELLFIKNIIRDELGKRLMALRYNSLQIV